MAAPREKDFGKSEPQVKSVYQYRKPPDDVSVDAPGGGKNVKPVEITDENFDSGFKHEPEHKPVKPIYTGRGK